MTHCFTAAMITSLLGNVAHAVQFSLCWHPLFGVHKRSARVDECQWVPFSLHGGIQWHTSASYALPCQIPFCQTAFLLPSVTRQQHVTGYWQEGSTSTAVPPTSTSDVTGQQNIMGGIISGAALASHLKWIVFHQGWIYHLLHKWKVWFSSKVSQGQNKIYGKAKHTLAAW